MRRRKWCQFRTVQSVPCELIYKRYQHQQMHSSIYSVFYYKILIHVAAVCFNKVGVSSLRKAIAPEHVGTNKY